MSKPLTILSIVLIFFLTLFLTLNYLYKTSPTIALIQSTFPTTYPLQPTPYIPQYTIGASLGLLPEQVIVQTGIPSSVKINIGSDGEYPTEVQIELAYDPNILTNLNITPGDFFPNPTILLKNIDQTAGRISYALQLPTEQNPGNKAGTVATIFFTAKPTTQKTKTKIYILPKTSVKSHEHIAKLKETIGFGSEILVLPPLNTASPSPRLAH